MERKGRRVEVDSGKERRGTRRENEEGEKHTHDQMKVLRLRSPVGASATQHTDLPADKKNNTNKIFVMVLPVPHPPLYFLSSWPLSSLSLFSFIGFLFFLRFSGSVTT